MTHGALSIFLESKENCDEHVRYCELYVNGLVIRISPVRTLGFLDLLTLPIGRAIKARFQSLRLETETSEDDYFSVLHGKTELRRMCVSTKKICNEEQIFINVGVIAAQATDVFPTELLSGETADMLDHRDVNPHTSEVIDCLALMRTRAQFRLDTRAAAARETVHPSRDEAFDDSRTPTHSIPRIVH